MNWFGDSAHSGTTFTYTRLRKDFIHFLRSQLFKDVAIHYLLRVESGLKVQAFRLEVSSLISSQLEGSVKLLGVEIPCRSVLPPTLPLKHLILLEVVTTRGKRLQIQQLKIGRSSNGGVEN